MFRKLSRKFRKISRKSKTSSKLTDDLMHEETLNEAVKGIILSRDLIPFKQINCLFFIKIISITLE